MNREVHVALILDAAGQAGLVVVAAGAAERAYRDPAAIDGVPGRVHVLQD